MNPAQVLNALLFLFLLVLTADRFVVDEKCICSCQCKEGGNIGSRSISHFLVDLGLVSWGENVPPVLTSVPKHFELRANPYRPLTVDVGLYDGQETVAAALAGYMVFSFEPVSAHIETVKKNLLKENITFRYFDLRPDQDLPGIESFRGAMEGLLKKTNGQKAGPVLLFHAAVGSHTGSDHIHVPAVGQASSLSDSRIQSAPSEHVKVVSLDDVVPVQYDVSVFKTDTQGYELFVLRGAKRMLERTSVCICEFWPKGLLDAGASGGELLDEFARSGFMCFDLRGADPGRPSSFENYTRWFIEHPTSERWGRYGDIMCINTRE